MSGVIRKEFPAKIGARRRKIPALLPAGLPNISEASNLPATTRSIPETIAQKRTASAVCPSREAPDAIIHAVSGGWSK